MQAFRSWRIWLALFGIVLVFGLLATTSGWFSPPVTELAAQQKTLALNPPPFLQAAQAATNFDVGAYLDQEAGISAWLYTTVPVNLSGAASAFRVIEDQTSDYIIGSVAIPNYEEHYDVHAYIHTGGYILAYYLRTDPASKIISIKEQSITTTKLEAAIGIVAGAAGVPSAGINYYDFRYPNAENILLVYEDTADGNDFTIQLPGTFVYFERGFTTHCYSGCSFNLDGTNLTAIYNQNGVAYGTISAAQLAPDVTHTIIISGYAHSGALMIIFTEP